MNILFSLEPVFQFVIIALIIVAIMRVLKFKGVFTDSYQPVFDKIVTELAVPAVIFSIFVTYDFSPDTFYPSLILFVTLIIALFISAIICYFCHFPPRISGAIIMASGFGSTATMAAPLLTDLLSAHPDLIEKGVTIGTIGVAFPFFTIGVIIASYFGAKEAGRDVKITDSLKEFLFTPIFVSFVVGLLAAFFLLHFQIPGGEIFSDLFTDFFKIINLSLNLLIWIAIGLMLRPIKIRFFLPILLMVVVIKMLFEPFLASGLAISLGLPVTSQLLLIIETMVPSGAIAAVLASRYGCDSSLAGWIVVGTYLASLLTVPMIFLFYPG